jgi:hypothetical protein
MGTWDARGRLTARPAKGGLDPTDPANKTPVYLRNSHGIPVVVEKWLAHDILNDSTKRGWKKSTKAAYEKHLKEYKPTKLDKKYEELMKQQQGVGGDKKVEELEKQISTLTETVSKLINKLDDSAKGEEK